MKKQLLSLFALALVFMMCFSVPVDAKPKLSAKKVTLEVGESKTIKLFGNKKKVKWTSSNKNVKIVSKSKTKVKIKAVKAGKTTITAKIGSKKYKCTVTVKNKIGFEKSKYEVYIGEEVPIVFNGDFENFNYEDFYVISASTPLISWEDGNKTTWYCRGLEKSTENIYLKYKNKTYKTEIVVKEKIRDINDNWENSDWNFKINDAYLTDIYSKDNISKKEVLAIEYEYQNKVDFMKYFLYFSESEFYIIDENGYLATFYSYKNDKEPRKIPYGVTENVTVYYELKNPSDFVNLKIYLEDRQQNTVYTEYKLNLYKK